MARREARWRKERRTRREKEEAEFSPTGRRSTLSLFFPLEGKLKTSKTMSDVDGTLGDALIPAINKLHDVFASVRRVWCRQEEREEDKKEGKSNWLAAALPRHGLHASLVVVNVEAFSFALAQARIVLLSDSNLVMGSASGPMLLRTENDKITQERAPFPSAKSWQRRFAIFDVVRRNCRAARRRRFSSLGLLLPFSHSLPPPHTHTHSFFRPSPPLRSPPPLPGLPRPPRRPPPGRGRRRPVRGQVLGARGPGRQGLSAARRRDLHAEAAAAAAGEDRRRAPSLLPRRRRQGPQGEEGRGGGRGVGRVPPPAREEVLRLLRGPRRDRRRDRARGGARAGDL